MTPNIDFYEKFFSPKESSWYLKKMTQSITWKQKTIKLFGKNILEPRLTAWHGDSSATYTYSGTTMVPAPWNSALLKIKTCVEKACDSQFNSVLLNLYRNQFDSMGMHSDDEKELGPHPVIASVSFGETRRFILKARNPSLEKPITYHLNSGSLLIMRGNLQAKWKHGVPKESRACEARINLTFRTILTQPVKA